MQQRETPQHLASVVNNILDNHAEEFDPNQRQQLMGIRQNLTSNPQQYAQNPAAMQGIINALIGIAGPLILNYGVNAILNRGGAQGGGGLPIGGSGGYMPNQGAGSGGGIGDIIGGLIGGGNQGGGGLMPNQGGYPPGYNPNQGGYGGGGYVPGNSPTGGIGDLIGGALPGLIAGALPGILGGLSGGQSGQADQDPLGGLGGLIGGLGGGQSGNQGGGTPQFGGIQGLGNQGGNTNTNSGGNEL